MQPTKPRIAITGGIGSGKSYVCRLLEERGISVFNCDIVAKTIIATHRDVRAELTALITAESQRATDEGQRATVPLGFAEGQAVLTKQALGDYIRRGSEYAARVNAIVHPRVAEAFLASNYRWMECAILFESGFDRLVDRVAVVTCPEDERIRRIIARDHCDEATARRWLALQMTDEERLARAKAHNEAAERTRAGSAIGSGAVLHILNDGVTPIEPQLDALLASLAP